MAVPALGAMPSIGSVQPTAPSGYLQTDAANPSADAGAGFQSQLAGAVDGLGRLQSTSNELTVQAVTGDLNDIHRATLASTRAQVTLELVAAVRNKGVDAFNEIMRMQA